MRASTKFAVATLLVGGALALASVAHADEVVDTVFLINGGRVRGAVMVDDAKLVSVKLADGKTKEIARNEVMRIEYAAAAATETAAASKAKARPKVSPVEEEEEAEEASPKPKRKRRYYTTDDSDRSPEQTHDDEAAKQRRITGANRMIAAGGALCAIGWAAVLGGLFAVGFGAVNGDSGPVVGGALVTGFSLPIGITGSVLLGVGSRSKRSAASAFITDDRTEWNAAFQLEQPTAELPPLSLTFAF